MQQLDFQQILILLIVLLFPLLQLAFERVRRRNANSLPKAETEVPERRRVQKPAVLPPEPPAVIEGRPVLNTTRTPPRPHGRVADNTPLGGRAGLRRAVVWSVILGPCRANDPPD